MHELSLKETKKEWHGTLKGYLIGFIACLVLTGASFLLVLNRPFSEAVLVYLLAALALVQAIFQLLCFLHLGQEDKPRWESFTFYFMVVALIIIAVGSLWIMFDLNYRVMGGMSHD